MSEAQKTHTPEKLPESELSTQDSTSDTLSANETLTSVDATPNEESLPGYVEKDSTKSSKLGTSASSPKALAAGTCEDGCRVRQPWVNTYWVNRPPSEDPDIPEVIRPLDSYAKGYPRMAASHNCDANFSTCRKFGWLHNRVLLHLQTELVRLERGLQIIDDEQAEKLDFKGRVGVYGDFRDKSGRKEMLAEIRMKLAEYDDLVFRLQKKNAMKRPTRSNQITAFASAYENVVSSEADWTVRTDDLIALAADAAEQTWFYFVMHHAKIHAPRLICGIFQSREQRLKIGSIPDLYLYSPIRMDAFYRAIITVGGAAIVLGPISIPSLLARSPILTIYAFTLGFSIFCAVLTKASRDQVFAATGGYCALQMIVMLLGPGMR